MLLSMMVFPIRATVGVPVTLLMAVGKQRKIFSVTEPCYPCGRPRCSVWLLALAWSSPGHWMHLGNLSLSPCLPLVPLPCFSNKYDKYLKKKITGNRWPALLGKHCTIHNFWHIACSLWVSVSKSINWDVNEITGVKTLLKPYGNYKCKALLW